MQYQIVDTKSQALSLAFLFICSRADFIKNVIAVAFIILIPIFAVKREYLQHSLCEIYKHTCYFSLVCTYIRVKRWRVTFVAYDLCKTSA